MTTDREWQPIDTAPKDGTKILLVDEYGVMGVGGYVEDYIERSEFVRKAKDGDVFNTVKEDVGWWAVDCCCPSYWMHLPQAPK